MPLPDDNFDDFVNNWPLFKDRLVLFLGAGASIGAKNTKGLPLLNAYELRNHLWQEFKVLPGDSFDPAELRLMTLEHASAIIEARTGRTALSEHLVELFTVSVPLWQHVVLPYLNPRSLFTTNYDELIELGYRHTTVSFDVICNMRSPFKGRTALYKPHGSLTHANQPIGSGGLVITQFDYLDMISQYREMLRHAMTGFDAACVLIVGYSFGDMDIGAELYKLRRSSAGIPWYAIFPRADPLVRRMYSRKFGMEQIGCTFEEFLNELDSRVDFIPKALKRARKEELVLKGIIQ